MSCVPRVLGTAHSLGTCAFGTFGNSGPLDVSIDRGADPVSVGIEDGVGEGASPFWGANKFGRSVEGAEIEENGFEASFVGVDWVLVSLGASVEDAVCGLNAENVDVVLEALGTLLFSGWKVWEKRPELVVLGCAALNNPAWGFSAPEFLAGCGVLNPLRNRLEVSASGALLAGASESFLEVSVPVSLFCAVPNMLKPDVLVDDGGLAIEENRFGFGVSDDALVVGSGAFRLLNKEVLAVAAPSSGSLMAPKGLLTVLGAFSCA
jgi:hypothetical protein